MTDEARDECRRERRLDRLSLQPSVWLKIICTAALTSLINLGLYFIDQKSENAVRDERQVVLARDEAAHWARYETEHRLLEQRLDEKIKEVESCCKGFGEELKTHRIKDEAQWDQKR